jgi:hypothetical protein
LQPVPDHFRQVPQASFGILPQQVVLRVVGEGPQEFLDPGAFGIEMFPIVQQGDGAIQVERQISFP